MERERERVGERERELEREGGRRGYLRIRGNSRTFMARVQMCVLTLQINKKQLCQHTPRAILGFNSELLCITFDEKEKDKQH
jgi:hypothetical protein